MRKHYTLLVWIGSVLGILALAVAGYGWLSQKQRRPTGPIEKIMFGVETSLLPAAVWIAEAKGYFQEEGLDVEIREFASGRTALKTMLEEGNLDMVTVAQTPVVLNSFKRSDYAIIAAMVSSDSDVKVLARKDRGIQAPLDLKGKTIGITKGSTGHFFLGSFLSHNGINNSEVETSDLEAARLAQALVDGQVDAISTWEPHISRAQSLLGESALLFDSGGIFREDFYFVPNKTFIDQHPEALKRFLKAIDRGETFIQKNSEEAIDIVSKRLKIERKLTASIWNDFKFRLFLDQSMLVTLEDEARWAIKNKLTDKTKIPNYLNFIYPAALEAIKPDAVTIIR